MKCSLGISNFLEEISSLSYSIIFLSFHWSLRQAFLSLLAILWNSTFKWMHLSFSPLLFTSLLFTAICKASSDDHFAFLHFFLLEMVLIPVSCTMSWTSVHSSPGSLSIRSSPLNLFLTSNGLLVPPTFFNLSLILAIGSSWSEPQSAPCLFSADCIELLHLWPPII